MPIFSVTTEGTEALAAATRETVIQIRSATTRKPKIVAWGVSFDGATATAVPVLVELERQTTDGTGSAASEVLLDPDAPTADITAFHSFSSQPTAGDKFEQHQVHPQGGLIIREYPPGREIILDNATTSRVGISVTAAAIVNCVAWMQWEE